jgi:predicted ATP-dependent endonuclease of OLD family
MKLKIKKFMPIKEECEIDLNKKFLVFVGKNNSGKRDCLL